MQELKENQYTTIFKVTNMLKVLQLFTTASIKSQENAISYVRTFGYQS